MKSVNQVTAVDFVHGAGLLMAPTKAVAQLLTRNGLSFCTAGGMGIAAILESP